MASIRGAAAVGKGELQVALADRLAWAMMPVGKGEARGRGARRRRGPRARSARSARRWRRRASARRRSVRSRGPALPAPCRASSSDSRAIAGSSWSRATAQPRRHLVPAALQQQPLGGQPLDRRAKVDARDRAARALALVAVDSPITTAGRLVASFSRDGDDADDAGVPAFARGPDQRRVEPARLRPAPARRRARRPRSRGVRC